VVEQADHAGLWAVMVSTKTMMIPGIQLRLILVTANEIPELPEIANASEKIELAGPPVYRHYTAAWVPVLNLRPQERGRRDK
jgi:hypothetical protein